MTHTFLDKEKIDEKDILDIPGSSSTGEVSAMKKEG
jgi:hypothetical protein